MKGIVEDQKIHLVGKYSATLSVIEVALGSLLHTFHIPFSGNFLSLNQGYLLCRVAIAAERSGCGGGLPLAVSNVAAVLKSLAPAGKKLGPMLSLSVQGLLFSMGVGVFGVNLLGLAVGMVLLSLWTFLQPVITYYLFFGSELPRAVQFLFSKTLPYHGLSWRILGAILLSVVVLKIGVAISLAFWAWKNAGEAPWQDRLLAIAKQKGVKPILPTHSMRLSRRRVALLALRDLTRPLFLSSLFVTLVFLFFSEREGAAWVWVLLRPLAIGFCFFYFSRTLTLDRWLARLHGTKGEMFARFCQRALGELRQITG